MPINLISPQDLAELENNDITPSEKLKEEDTTRQLAVWNKKNDLEEKIIWKYLRKYKDPRIILKDISELSIEV